MMNTANAFKDQPGERTGADTFDQCGLPSIEWNARRRARPPVCAASPWHQRDAPLRWIACAPAGLPSGRPAWDRSKGDCEMDGYALTRIEAEPQAAKKAPSRKAFTAS